jgi:hypothetical protein
MDPDLLINGPKTAAWTIGNGMVHQAVCGTPPGVGHDQSTMTFKTDLAGRLPTLTLLTALRSLGDTSPGHNVDIADNVDNQARRPILRAWDYVDVADTVDNLSKLGVKPAFASGPDR